jgi:hypothetical protein
MKKLFLFREDGSCFNISYGVRDDLLDNFIQLNNPANYVFSEKDIQIEKAFFENNELIEKEPVISAEVKYRVAKEKRNLLLTDSDWTDTLSSKTRLGDDLYNAWQAYRQALRDLTKQEGFPQNVVWPTKPE